jgi:hypothetical protein
MSMRSRNRSTIFSKPLISILHTLSRRHHHGRDLSAGTVCSLSPRRSYSINIGMLSHSLSTTPLGYFGRSLFAIALAIAVAAYAFRISLAAKPVFGMAPLKEE